jgi:predicted DNA-binding transcriptional regulator AlpA
MDQIEKLLFTVKETAVVLGIHRQSVYNSIGKYGQLPNFPKPRYIGKRPMFHRADLEAYIENLPNQRIPRKKAA